MPDVFAALEMIAGARRDDPLAPVTVVVPSHAAGLQLRRRLAELGPFAGVRFEMPARIAELLAAGHLAAAGRSPLARPIGDYVAEVVARESQGTLARVGELPGYARALRVIFRRLRRGGIRSSEEAGIVEGGQVAEVLRLYDRFREETAKFYDDEDLLEAAAEAVRAGRSEIGDLGAIYVVPPAGETAGSAELLAALRERAPSYVEIHEPTSEPEASFVLAPDPASEAREVVREVVAALEGGVALHEIAVLHGADRAYRRLLREAFAAADIPAVPLPGVPLIESRAGRGVLGLAHLPGLDFPRTAVMELLTIAPMRDWLPAGDRKVRALASTWDRASREAGITKGPGRWQKSLAALRRDLDESAAYHEAAGNEARARAQGYLQEQAKDLADVMEALISRLEPLRDPQPAAQLIERFAAIVEEYFAPEDEALPEVLAEVQQLGTVGAVGGSFSLAAFGEALRANLETATMRLRGLGSGVVVSDYRAAAGLRLKLVILCGAYEGSLPAGPGSDALVDDSTWTELRRHHPLIEDVALRVERGRAAAERAVRAAGGGGTIVWTVPLREPGGTREYYPSPLMRDAASSRDPTIKTASNLRAHGTTDGWLRRGRSPLSVALAGPVAAPEETRYRWAVGLRRAGDWVDPQHRLWPAAAMLRARRSPKFTAWDGNLASLVHRTQPERQRSASPTSLENYAVCGFRYFAKSVLGLYPIEEPEERDMMDAATRGTLIHDILHRFFREQKERGRPAQGESWVPEDAVLLMRLADEALAAAEERGLTGLSVYSAHEARTIKADLRRFLEEDTLFRQQTGAVPAQFETHIPETEIAGVTLKGVVDRVDVTPDGKRAWVIDYKTGGLADFKEIKPEDPLAGGKKLQLPVYMKAAPDAEEVHALYWFITQKGGFESVEYDPSPERREAFERTLEAILAGVQAGSFPAVPGEDNEYYGRFDNCRYCDYDRICSRHRDLEMAAKETDELMAPWWGVKLAATGEDSE
ncbi:MAG TPA: PD-(D/E)XK nuclease family protein [Dehalococcoidia bacterium]|jgi:RecB family exonuclease|nr:PD-(D/E)XK nuclease family protein [Dehalococcoidia bacterium]